MRRTKLTSRRGLVALIATLVVALAVPASGGVGLDSNLGAAFGHLNLDDADFQHILDNSWTVEDPTLFNFAASLDPPSIDPVSEPWGVPVRIGVTWATWNDPSNLPAFPIQTQEVNGSLYFPAGGPETGVEYALMWAQMGGPIPVTDPMDLFQNWSFPIAVPGEPTWIPNSAFPNDTWGNASIIPHITYGPNPWDFGLSRVQPDGSLAPQDFNGFGLISGDTIIVAVDSGSLLTNGPDGLLYGFAGHIHDGGFGATPQSQSLVSYATGLPGTLIMAPPPSLLDVGNMAPPTTTTTTSTTSTTLTQSTSSTVGPTGGEGDTDSDSEGAFPVLAVLLGLLGIVVIVVGGRIFFAAKDDPCTELLKAWEEAQKACDEAASAAAEAKNACDEAEQKTADLEKQVNDICKKWPPACEDEGASAEVSGRPETRVTSRDLHARRIAMGRLWDDYQAGKIEARDVEDAWRQMDTPRFREELRRETERKIEEREKLERELKDARQTAHNNCESAQQAGETADTACAKAEAARRAYEECVKEQAAEDFVDAFMGLGADASAPSSQTETQQAATAPPPAEVAPQRKIGVPVPTSIDTTGMTEAESQRARRLENIFNSRKGSGDIAAVALDLYQFNSWHIKEFGEPWFTWSTGERNPNAPTATTETSERFMQTRVMACYEFVHFAAYIASDQLGRQRVGGEDDDNPIFLDEYSVDWGFGDDINTNTQPLTGQAPRGSVVTGSFRWGDYDNTAGYYHTGIAIGDGKIISLGSDGLILEDTTGKVGGCFPSIGYTDIQYGEYAYGSNNPAPAD